MAALLLLASGASACSYPYNLSNEQVWGLESTAAGDASPAACEAACCARGAAACDTWQFCLSSAFACKTAGCWSGIAAPQAQRAPVAGWVSMTAVAPPPPASDRFIDASAPPPAPAPIAGLAPVTNPKTGATLSIDSTSLLLNGERILPFSGEMHFSRTPRAAWAADLAAMKAGGLDIVQAYVFWLHTEEVKGVQDWTDNRALGALRRLLPERYCFALVTSFLLTFPAPMSPFPISSGEFVDEAAAAGLMVALRIGPWCHGEVRRGAVSLRAGVCVF